jgi:hypothetical protein
MLELLLFILKEMSLSVVWKMSVRVEFVLFLCLMLGPWSCVQCVLVSVIVGDHN